MNVITVNYYRYHYSPT